MDCLVQFMDSCEEKGVDWAFLDVAGGTYEDILDYDNEWTGYSKVIDNFCQTIGVTTDIHTGLFIIGGDDVIPMPKVENPVADAGSENAIIDVDMLYALGVDAEGELNEGPRFSVGRLPLENGDIDSSLDDDLGDYLNRVASVIDQPVADDKEFLMTTAEPWIGASTDMVSEIPQVYADESRKLTKNGMFISPKLDAGDDSTMEVFNGYLYDQPILMFNLHGSNEEGYSSFYGQHKDYFPEAFTIDEMLQSDSNVLITCACFGARYCDYSRDDSMLLQAIYSHYLLYCGSCVSAWGGPGGNKACYSEHLLKRFAENLCQGLDAGEAMLTAKMDYLYEDGEREGYDLALGTIYMFNLYGCPLLTVYPDRYKSYSKMTNKLNIKHALNSLQPERVIYSRDQQNTDLLSTIRSQVDQRLAQITETINKTLYEKIGMEPKHLTTISEISDGTKVTGYNFKYTRKSGPIKTSAIARTDANGNIVNIIASK